MATNVAIVDDRDSLIQYAGTWTNGGAPIEFHGSTKWSSSEGSTASFTFVGTSVTVYASVEAHHADTATMSFTVDNSPAGSYTSPSNLGDGLYHEALWTSPTMSEGTHTLVITQTVAQSGGRIYLDYLTYETTSVSVGSYFVDDRDPSITYTPEWRKFDQTQNDFQHTSQESTSAGDSFSIKFEGKSIAFYGGLTSSDVGVIASIVLDGGTPVLYTTPSDPPAWVNNLIFNSGEISDGPHTLVVTATTDHTLWADYFLIGPGTPASPATPPTPPTTTTTTTAVSSGTTTSVSPNLPAGSSGSRAASVSSGSTKTDSHSTKSGASSTPSSLGSSPSSGSSSLSSAAPGPLSSDSSSLAPPLPISAKSTPVAAIVAAILGALLLIALVLAALFCLRRRRRNRARKTAEPPMANALAARPFSAFVASSAPTSCEPPSAACGYSVVPGSTSNLELSSGSDALASSESGKLAEEARRQQAHSSTTNLLRPQSATRSRPPSTVFSGGASTVGTEAPPQYSA
ncbi:hypothetical protein DFH09DRAFT_1019948 [Mycena vulgaris]|nr:hypothetical protein DFH09DRAFT_1019948 [Mycena vulgaris]